MIDTVTTLLPQGAVTGVREGPVCRFSAIPFAQAPVGALRFRPPVPATWHGTLDATRRGPIPPQTPSRLRDAMGDFNEVQSEDCLRLTVWTPAVDRRRRPVVVWLHGGAWQSGAGDLDWYSGARLAARGDIVVVAPNYRLAALGWLAIPGETANVGLLDQECAIDWVRANIQAFGGDHERVTVMGQSAGALSIACMLMREPRFERAILQSAPLGRPLRSLAKAQEVASIFLDAAGAADAEAARRLPVEALLRAQQAPRVVEWLTAERAQRSLFGPVADGDVLPATADTDFRSPAGCVDVMVGSTRDEMAAFPGLTTDERSSAIGESIFRAPSRRWAADAAAQGRRAWAYSFDVRPTERFGACHCIELPFVFDTLEAFAEAPMLRGLGEGHARRLAAEVQRAWGAFINGGDPGWAPWPEEKRFT